MKRANAILLLVFCCQVIKAEGCPASHASDIGLTSNHARFLVSNTFVHRAEVAKDCKAEIQFSLENHERQLRYVSENNKKSSKSGQSHASSHEGLKHSSEDLEKCDFPSPKRGSLVEIALSFCPLPEPSGNLIGSVCEEMIVENLRPEPPVPPTPICRYPEPTRAVIITPPEVISEPPCFEFPTEELPPVVCVYPEPERAEAPPVDIPEPACVELDIEPLPLICYFPEPERAVIIEPQSDLPEPVCSEVESGWLPPLTPSIDCIFPEPTRAIFEFECEESFVVKICEETPLKPIRIEPDEPDDCTPDPITPIRIPDDPTCNYPEPNKADFKFSCGENSTYVAVATGN